MRTLWICFEISMKWFVNGGVVVQKDGSLYDKNMFKLELLSDRNRRTCQCCQHRGSKKVRRAWLKWLLYGWTFSSILVSLMVFHYMNSLSLEKRRESLASMCDERSRMLQDQFNVSMNHIQALSIMISTFHHAKYPSAIDQETFAKYAERTAFERPLTSGVAYAVRILHSAREQFERQQGWTIKKMYSQQKSPESEDDYAAENHEKSPFQEEYAPVIFAQETVSHVISMDMLTGKEDKDNVLRSRSSGKGVLTAPFRLLKSNRLGVILTFAVYKSELSSNATPDERIEATDGYLGGIFDIESLVEKLLHQLASKQTIVVNVYDTTNASEPISMYGQDVADDSICHASVLNFGDPFRRHEMHCRFKNRRPWPILEMSASFGIFVISSLIEYIYYAAMNRIAKVEDEYDEMIELKKRAEAADVAKSQFLATVSHEIRTPLNGVLGMLQLLMDTELDITQQDYVSTAQASGKALVSLINEVLDQAKIESGKIELEAVPFNLRTLLDDVLSLFAENSQNKGLELAVDISDQVPEILVGDPGRFRQIITNLMGNSIKFTEKGHILVTVHLIEEIMKKTDYSSMKTLSTFPVPDRRRSWEKFLVFSHDTPLSRQISSTTSTDFISLIISVEDSGIGIPYEAQSKVFTPFMQVGPSISRIHGGTGIGLSISKCLVSLMNGEIGFVSEPNIGSTFTFTAVFARGNFVSDKLNGSDCQSESFSTEFRGMKAWIIDMRPERSRITRYHLQRLGIHVDSLPNFHQAIKIASGSSHVNLILVEKEALDEDPSMLSTLMVKLRKDLPSIGPKLFVLTNSSNTKLPADEVVPFIIMKPLRTSMLAASLQRAMGIGTKVNGQHDTVPASSLKNLLKGRKILIVDDNKVNLKVAEGALKKFGASVQLADSGKKAIKLLTPPHNFDACFMDIQMPEIDGFEATRRIREIEHNKNEQIVRGESPLEACDNKSEWHLPILAMTADVIQATPQECQNCGMDGYVSKPFEGEQLYQAVARFFKFNQREDGT